MVDASGTIKGRYLQLKTLRDPFLQRARDCSKLTIPTLIPPQDENRNTTFSTPYQGLGARGVNNLAAKLLLALFPPNASFFRLSLSEEKIPHELLQADPQIKTELDGKLAKMERRISKEIEGSSIRVGMFEALKHLLVGGNILIYAPEEGGLRVFHLDRYVVKRDPQGLVLEIITRETTVPQALKPEIIALADIKVDDEKKATEDTVEIYTRIERSEDNKMWVVDQEVNGVLIPDSHGTFPIDESPWIPLRLIAIDNEDYGRGYVEEYLGDLISLEALTKAIVQGSVAAARVLFLVRPNGSTKLRVVAEAPNGEAVVGNADDVTILRLDKFNDFRVALECMQKITERLSFSFMLNAAVQRQAERVTAQEVMYMAGELEDSLGGVYSVLSQELQLPFVKRLMSTLTKQKKLPVLPKGIVNPVIVTGLEALGRGHDLQKLNAFLQQLMPLGPEVISRYMNIDDYIARSALGLGIDTDGLIKTKEEIQQAEQQAMMMQLATQLGPNIINKGAELANTPTQ